MSKLGWIAIACPFQGAPRAVNGFIQGYNLGDDAGSWEGILSITGLSNTTGHQLIMQYPSVYELLPLLRLPGPSQLLSFSLVGSSAVPTKSPMSNYASVLQNINGLNEVTYSFDGIYDRYGNHFQDLVWSKAPENKDKWNSLPAVEPLALIPIYVREHCSRFSGHPSKLLLP